MATTIFMHNLPPDITEQELKDFFKERGNEGVEEVELNREGNADRVTAVVKVNVDATTAQIMADHAKQRTWRGRKITIQVPLDQ